MNTLANVKDDKFKKYAMRNEANGLYNQMQNLETSFMIIFLNNILVRFINSSNEQLQCLEIGNDKAFQMYASLIDLIKTTRDNFKDYENMVKKISRIQ